MPVDDAVILCNKNDMRDRAGGCEDLSFVADFADDGVLGGDYEAVLKVLKAEAALGGEYGLRNNFSKMKVYTVAGESFEGDLAGFESLGIPIDKSCNVEFMKVPIVGDRLFLKAWGEEKLRDIRKTLTAIERLASKHVGLYLLRTAANVCKILYITRTTPRDMIEGLLEGFDISLMHAVEEVIGLRLEEKQCMQVELRVGDSGLGLRLGKSVADGAYVSSRAMTFEVCEELDTDFAWDATGGPGAEDRDMGVGGEAQVACGLAGAIARMKEAMPEYRAGGLDVPGQVPKQKEFTAKLDILKKRAVEEGGSALEKARLHAMSAPHAGAWLEAPPSRAQDTRFTNEELHTRVGRRLGIKICEECTCPFCFAPMDGFGAHAETCMGGGDKVTTHNCTRDTIYKQAQAANIAPQLEAAGVLAGESGERGGAAGEQSGDDRRRPADVLVCRAQDIRTGNGGAGVELRSR